MPGDLVGVGQAGLRGPEDRGARWWWLGLPIVPFQGYRLIRTMARFADAEGVTGRVGSGDRHLRVVALGDSVAAGYAVGHHRSSVAGQLAVRLADRYGARVDWRPGGGALDRDEPVNPGADNRARRSWGTAPPV